MSDIQLEIKIQRLIIHLDCDKSQKYKIYT
jgi:hypothetical protein